MKGLFVTFEGADATGKTTQIKMLAKALEDIGVATVVTREPGGTDVAEKIRSLLLDKEMKLSAKTELLLYLAARTEHVENVIRPALQQGKIVICDRFLDSTIAYQGFARGFAVEVVDSLNSFATDGLLPDVTFLLDAQPELLEQRLCTRGEQNRLDAESTLFKAKVREGFLALQQQHPKRIKLVEAARLPEQIHAEVWTILESKLQGE